MARKPKDITVLHGHRVITGPELRATFVADDDPADHSAKLRRKILHGVVLMMLLGLIVTGVMGAVAVMNGQIKLESRHLRSIEETAAAQQQLAVDLKALGEKVDTLTMKDGDDA